MSIASHSQRAPSPSNTTYSGISNYRTDSYRRKTSSGTPTFDARKAARTHFDELQIFLGQHLAKEPPNSRTSAREKLARLTKQQFYELSTDVYDELNRRNHNTSGNEVPFLPVKSNFHPKRNTARQKLATLPQTRFKDLAGDVFFELNRRYPEFKEPEVPTTPGSPPSTYDDSTSPDFYDRTVRQTPSQTQPPLPTPSIYSPLLSSRRNLSREQNSPFPVTPTERRRPSQEKNDFYAQSDRRRPSEDTLRSTDRSNPSGRRPSGDDAVSTSTVGPAATATSGVVIPNKSTIAEEKIEVPYGREDDARGMRGSRSSAAEEENEEYVDEDRETEDDASVGFKSPVSPPSGLGGLSALSAIGNRRMDRKNDSDDEGNMGRSDSDDYDRPYGAVRTLNDGPSRSGNNGPARQASSGDVDRVKREYELKITTMQSRINGLEGDLSDATSRRLDADETVRKLTAELEMLRSRAKEESVKIISLRRELEDMRAAHANDSKRLEDEEEIQRLRERCEELESERGAFHGSEDNTVLMEQLRSDLENVLMEANELSNRNEELMAGRDTDNNLIRDLNAQMKEYKRKYEQAKTELRSVKATSQLYHQAPKPIGEDQLPVTPSGGLLDIHVTAFLSSIDLLLTAGRSSTPARVYAPMKVVVNAVHAIIEDVRNVEARPRRERLDVDLEDLQALRERADMTLSNLVAAARTHASSLGMSPVSLLDAAASHVSSAVTEIGKTIQVRKATKAEQESFSSPTSPSTSGYAPALRAVDEKTMGHLRTASSASSSRGEDYSSSGTRTNGRYREMSPPPKINGRNATARRSSSDPSSSNASSPPAIFDAPLDFSAGSDESAAPEGPDDAWAELKPYLEAQSESIVYAIQSVLSAVRSPAPSPNLNENLTQIITIVSSIVAVCKDSLPSASLKEGNDLLRDLSDHCDKLSEIQAMPEVTKESRQAMAKSSFAVANAMKSLVKM
ncbi:hypothetical protein K439DRAFT_1384048 [Ramaria rubella]|nr:hypothetical protein K439DRAFT_1384048 [Ramaria rubella]